MSLGFKLRCVGALIVPIFLMPITVYAYKNPNLNPYLLILPASGIILLGIGIIIDKNKVKK